MNTHRKEVGDGYKSFLVTEAGKDLLSKIDYLIDDYHKQAELDADYARDHTQTAKGVRAVQEHINSMVSGGTKIR